MLGTAKLCAYISTNAFLFYKQYFCSALFCLYIYVNQKIKNMTNIELLELIASKIDAVRDEINDLSLTVVEDENYDLVFDTIVSITTDLENTSSTAIMLSEEIDTIEI